jgi:hypothetical protein
LLRVLAAWLHGELIVPPAAQGARQKRDGAQARRRGTAATLAALGMKASGGAAEGK